jgi:OmpA-OmpF porin, OOP family
MNKTTKIALVVGVSVISIFAGVALYMKLFKKKSLAETIKDAYDNLLFDFGKATIKESSFPFLDELAQALIDNPTYGIDIIGHTDNVGSATANLKLSQDRANSVRTYLISKGIDGIRLQAIGKGMTEPISDNSTAEGRAANRRVEFIIKNLNV